MTASYRFPPRTGDQKAEACVLEIKRDNPRGVSSLKNVVGVSTESEIPDYALIAYLGSESDFLSLIAFCVPPWKFPDTRTENGNTPAHLIAMRRDATPTLIERSRILGAAYGNLKNDHGQTPLDLARYWDKPGVVAAVETAIMEIDGHSQIATEPKLIAVAQKTVSHRTQRPTAPRGQQRLPF